MRAFHQTWLSRVCVLVVLSIILTAMPTSGSWAFLVQAQDPVQERAERPNRARPPSLSMATIPAPTPTPTITAEPSPSPTPEPTELPPAAPAQSIQASLRTVASPDTGSPDDQIELSLYLTAKEDLDMVTVYGELPQGLSFSAILDGNAGYMPEEHALLWVEERLQAGEERMVRIQVTINEQAPDLMRFAFSLSAPDRRDRSGGQVTVKREFGATTVDVSSEEGGTLRSADGRVEVVFPPGAVDKNVRVVHHAERVAHEDEDDSGPMLQFSLNAYTNDREGAPVRQFLKPLQLRVDVADLIDWGHIPYYLYVSLFYWDEETESWQTMPSSVEDGIVTADLSHFTDFGINFVGIESYGWVPSMNSAHVALFDGALKYDYPIEVPPGRGGARKMC